MSDETELLELSQQLLDSIDQLDWDTYERLCDPTLTAYEPEAIGTLVEGMPFHQFYFKLPGGGGPRRSNIHEPHVRLMGDSAVVCYIRVVQKVDADGVPVSAACEETRVWQKQDGQWRHVHFHRSPVG